ncbi:hypothetical protein M413DRAFT_9723 [Hebeloma cylindrosporum]|uniref:Uncharacterized protein n=1 Tax=Hebeloma cylindrosporum TaxID=76867 RepID=A0A0C2Y1T4_HEBCY|nr:hypothetical protein M413DRAFT_9723 [Hebeloma cylindrosporum h7]
MTFNTTPDESKRWTSWLTLKRFRSQADIANSECRRCASNPSSIPFDKKTTTTVDIPVRPPSPTSAPTTKEEFQRAISEAQRYKDACSQAEAAADKEAQRRFKYYQEMFYVEKTLQRKSAEARRTLEDLTRRAKDVGFRIETVSPQTHSPESEDSDSLCDERLSEDSIDGFMSRLGVGGRF